eukprot:CAMPEP_0168532742 /NCGR_PEP_ID=MMETSP0405-20121227/16517_1 /TAXON_ID=498012 /ORGANISM="Trichosphaerium sp, Strain Am-I-7 wt" /LENGTH=110 /DNA_ID=CAMNT_0008558379 /DNA_START=1 /DNA_END=333 /DNA_ORIENTATION=+
MNRIGSGLGTRVAYNAIRRARLPRQPVRNMGDEGDVAPLKTYFVMATPVLWATFFYSMMVEGQANHARSKLEYPHMNVANCEFPWFDGELSLFDGIDKYFNFGLVEHDED